MPRVGDEWPRYVSNVTSLETTHNAQWRREPANPFGRPSISTPIRHSAPKPPLKWRDRRTMSLGGPGRGVSCPGCRVRVLTFTHFFSFRPSVHAAPPGVSTPGVHTPSLVLAHCSHTKSGVSTPRRGKNGDFEPQNAIFEPYTAGLCTYPRAPSPILARAEVLARVNTS